MVASSQKSISKKDIKSLGTNNTNTDPKDDDIFSNPSEWLKQNMSERVVGTVKDIADQTPLPDNFPFDYMFESYLWRAVFLTSFTLGIRFGGLSPVYAVVSALPIPNFIYFFHHYIIIPAAMVFFHKETKRSDTKWSVRERRILLIAVSFVLGTGAAVFNRHYLLVDGTPPSYFLPVLVGLSVQFAGPHLGGQRLQLLLVSVGSALTVAVSLLLVDGSFSASSLVSVFISAGVTTVNLQIIIATILRGSADMNRSHIAAVITCLWQHLVFSRVLGSFSADPHVATSMPSITKAIIN